ncbi:MAG: T9SS type A sorting domain-containing protein [Candidatus Cloacimonadia bacterium]
MSNTSGDTYQGTLLVQSDGARVEYYIEVTDNAKTTATSSTYGLFWGTSDISNASGKIKEVDANGVLVYDGYYARVTGVATVASGIYSTSYLDVYLQDSYGGINVYKGGAGTITIIAGNSYTAVGVLDQYNGKAEIIPDDAATDITDNGAGTMPSIEIITIAEYLANPEDYEGMLIGIQHLSKTAGSDPWPSSGSDANLTMTDDGGISEITLRVDKDTDLDENPEPSWPKDVVGIATQYDNSSPFDSGYQITPRAYSDIKEDGTLPVFLLSFTATYTSEYANGCVEIVWETASESDIRGFNIYRNADEDYLNAKPVNSEIIYPEGSTSQGAEYSFYDIDADVLTSWYYWLEVVNVGASNDVYGPITYQSIDFDDNGEQNIIATRLDGCYPNPVQRGYPVTFNFTLGGLEGERKHVELKIYNLWGELVDEVVSEKRSVREYEEHWTPTNLANGIYFYQLKTDSFNAVKKFVVVQ